MSFKWKERFLQRNPDLRIKPPTKLSLPRAMCLNREVVNKFFDLYEDILDQTEIPPHRIWNIDETGVDTIPDTPTVVGMKGRKAIQIVSAEKGVRTTVVTICNAVGDHFTPIVIHKGLRIQAAWYENAPDGAIIRCSPNGYIEKGIFTEYLDLWVDWLQENQELGFKHLVITDGHSTHVNNYEAIKTLEAENIDCLLIPAHSSHLLQPLDRTPFGQFKHYWSEELEKYNRRNSGRALNKQDFFQVLNPAWKLGVTPHNIRCGWVRSGLWPVDRHKITDEDLEANAAFCKSQNNTKLTVACCLPLLVFLPVSNCLEIVCFLQVCTKVKNQGLMIFSHCRQRTGGQRCWRPADWTTDWTTCTPSACTPTGTSTEGHTQEDSASCC